MWNWDADFYLLGKGSLCFQGIDSCLRILTSNSRHQSQHFRDHLESKLNQSKLNIDILHINGSLHKTDKLWRIRLFCDEGHIHEANFWVLVTTKAANVGIDKSQIALQVRFDWPCDLLTYFQERGRHVSLGWGQHVSYMLIYHLMYSFCVSSSMAASIPISLSNPNWGNVRASIQLFLHNVLRHIRQTQATKILP